MKRLVVLVAFVAGAGILAAGLTPLENSDRPPLEVKSVYIEPIEHPGHITRAFGYYVASEIYSGRLAFSKEPGFRSPVYLEPSNIDKKLLAPHFLDFGDGKRLLISEGWGGAIVSIENPRGASWKRMTGPPERKLYAPHGVCTSSNGQVYVADSLNSRLVRYDPEIGTWKVFDDRDAIVGYGRQLLCRDDGIWLANSYEAREGINPGHGGNVLRIHDFDEGELDVVASFPDTNITGISLIEDRWLVVGLWGSYHSLAVVDLDKGVTKHLPTPDGLVGPPYGLHHDEARGELIATWLGDIANRTHHGGIVVYRVNSGGAR